MFTNEKTDGDKSISTILSQPYLNANTNASIIKDHLKIIRHFRRMKFKLAVCVFLFSILLVYANLFIYKKKPSMYLLQIAFISINVRCYRFLSMEERNGLSQIVFRVFVFTSIYTYTQIHVVPFLLNEMFDLNKKERKKKQTRRMIKIIK